VSSFLPNMRSYASPDGNKFDVRCVSKWTQLRNGIAPKIWIDFDDIWQKYSKDSGIEFACFSYVGLQLLVITLSSLKLHTENNARMLCASVSC